MHKLKRTCQDERMSIQPTGVIPVFSRGDRLRKARELTGLGHSEFADELGVSRNTVTNYEREHVAPRAIVMKAWALRTGVPLQWLETGEAPSPGDGDGASVSLSQAKRARRDSNPQPSDSEPAGRVVELRPAVAA